MSNKPEMSDSKLSAALESWRVPPPSPWLQARATQGILASVRAERRSAWPFPPLRIATMATATALFGIVLGAALPSESQFASAQNISAQTVSMQSGSNLASDDYADTADSVDVLQLIGE